jgi:hypothetical protein
MRELQIRRGLMRAETSSYKLRSSQIRRDEALCGETSDALSKFFSRAVFFGSCFPIAQRYLGKSPTHEVARILEQRHYPAMSASGIR